jgi:hypothetical protein
VYDEEDGGEDEHQDNNPDDQEMDESTVADQWFAHVAKLPRRSGNSTDAPSVFREVLWNHFAW